MSEKIKEIYEWALIDRYDLWMCDEDMSDGIELRPDFWINFTIPWYEALGFER